MTSAKKENANHIWNIPNILRRKTFMVLITTLPIHKGILRQFRENQINRFHDILRHRFRVYISNLVEVSILYLPVRLNSFF